MAIKEFNVDLDVKGKVSATNVPNSTGSIVTWNNTSKVFGLRTNAQVISDLNLSSSFVPYSGATANVNLGSKSITSTGGFIGNASTATKLASITPTFTGTYPVTVNVNGVIYSHEGLTFTGSTGTLTATTFVGALNGNASTATKLQTARTINGTSFNGSANITTANWGTARNITIGNTTKSVNGSGNVSWSLAEIGAASQSSLGNYLPLSGGTMTGGGKIESTGNIKLQQNGSSNATGLFWQNLADTANIAGIGTHTNADTVLRLYMGWGNEPWMPTNNFSVSATELKYKNQDIALVSQLPIKNNSQGSNEVTSETLNLTNLDSGTFINWINSASQGRPNTNLYGGFLLNISKTVTNKNSFRFFMNPVADDELHYSSITKGSDARPWYRVASREWVTQQIGNISIPTVNNGQLTLSTGSGLSGSATFTANQAGGSTFTVGIASTHKLPTTAEWNTVFTNNHTHVNKAVLDGITSALITNWNTAYDQYFPLTGVIANSKNAIQIADGQNINLYKSGAFYSGGAVINSPGSGGIISVVSGGAHGGQLHVGVNGVLSFRGLISGTWSNWKKVWSDSDFTSGQITNWNTAFTNNHTHGNKAILDATTASFTTALKTKLDGLSNYVLPTASSTVLGGIKVGNNLSIDANGVLSATNTNTTYSAGTGLSLSGTTFSVKYGTASGTAAQGNDSRINNGQTAFGWGNHALAGYLTSTALNNYYQSNDVNIPAKGGDYRVFPEGGSTELFDFDTKTERGFYKNLFNAGAASTYNAPKSGFYGHVENIIYGSGSGSNILQYAHPYRVSDGKWMRSRFSGTWTPWVEFVHSGNLASYANSLLTGFVQTSRTITAGNGLSGGGTLASNRTITLGTPSAITLSSTNSVTETSHTHAFTPGGTTAQYIRGDGSLATMPTFTDTITRLRGTTSGTYTSGDLTLVAGANTTITQSGANITIASTNTNTTYSAGNGLTLNGTTFSLPVTTSGTGNFVTAVTQTATGITVTKGNPTITGFVKDNGITTIGSSGITIKNTAGNIIDAGGYYLYLGRTTDFDQVSLRCQYGFLDIADDILELSYGYTVIEASLSTITFGYDQDITVRGANITLDPKGVVTSTKQVSAPAFYETSLREFKENIVPLEKSGLDLVNSLEIVRFDRKSEGENEGIKNKIGVIADDTDEEFLSEEKDSVDIYKTLFIQAKAIQELNRKNKSLEDRLSRLEKLVNKLTSDL